MASTPEERRAKLAQLLRERNAATKRLPLSFAQERMWFLEQWSPGSPALHMPVAVRLTGTLDPAVLHRALQELVQRHEALRTTFAFADGRAVQIVTAMPDLPVVQVDLAELPEREREPAALQRIAEGARQPFDLGQGPLLRATLLRLSAREHLLLLVMHHIISDSWSMSVVVRELAAIYSASLDGRPSPLPPLPLQYGDYAAWQRKALQGDGLTQRLDAWRARLDPHAVLELPADKPRPAVLSLRGARQSIVLSPVLTQALKALGRREGRTLFTVLLAAFKVLLQRYTGRADLAVGTPVANRPRAELEGLIGLFVNTVVLRSDLSRPATFRDLMGQLQETALDAFSREDLPFEKVVEALKPDRDLGHSPLFQVMFILQNAPLPPMEAPGLRLEAWPVDTGTAQFDLMLIADDLPQGLRLTAEYNSDLFEATTATRLLAHLEALLTDCAAAPERPLAELTLLPEAERRQLLSGWNATAAPYPRDACIHELFEAQARRTPEAVALAYEGQTLTYRALDARANQLAWHLRSLGVGPEVCVGLCVERSFDLIVGMLATLKAGGAYVPLDPSYPRDRLAFMLQDSNVRALLVHAPLLERLPPHPVPVVRLDVDGALLSSQPADPLPPAAAPGSLAYVIYTSGSTGQPKGVLITHGSVCNLVTHESRTADVGPGARVLQFSNPGFDVSVEEIFTTLTSGATLHLAPLERLMPGEPLHRLLREQAITTLNATPAALAATESEGLPALRLVFSGGEACSADIVARWSQGRRFINGYGPTEVTVTATFTECQPDGRAPPIGRPMANTRVYVLDPRMRPAPVGVPGELYIGGAGLARGYRHRPDLTAERFVPDPFGEEPGARLYKSGDRVRWRADGQLEFLGRTDHQVKLRGFRIELGEIEAALVEHPAVREAVVRVQGEPPGRQQLVAWIVPASPDAPPTTADLHAFLARQLPLYMVPSAFAAVAALPISPNGKIDVAALPPIEAGRLDAGRPFAAPRTELEQRIAQVWAEVLQVERVGLDDPFFELGGNSMLALQLHRRLQTELALELALTELFQHPTVRALTERIARRSDTEDAVDAGQARGKARQRVARRPSAPRSAPDADEGENV